MIHVQHLLVGMCVVLVPVQHRAFAGLGLGAEFVQGLGFVPSAYRSVPDLGRVQVMPPSSARTHAAREARWASSYSGDHSDGGYAPWSCKT
jgi:hypothetical protein